MRIALQSQARVLTAEDAKKTEFLKTPFGKIPEEAEVNYEMPHKAFIKYAELWKSQLA